MAALDPLARLLDASLDPRTNKEGMVALKYIGTRLW